MGGNYIYVLAVCLLIPVSHTKDISNGIIVGVFPNAYFPQWWPGRLSAYAGDVDFLAIQGKSATYKSYNFKNPSTSVTSIAADVRNEALYYLDVSSRGLYRMNNVSIYMNRTDTTVERIHEGTSYALGHLTYDWISQNIYWTDRYHNWISMKPVYSNDTLMYKVILENQIIVPIGLAVDPVEGYLFWTDTMPSRRIERANLLGEERRVLISTSIGFPTGLVVDRQEKRIYWSDVTRFTVESATYDGFNRKTIHRENAHPFYGIMTYKEHVCVTEHYHNSLLCYSKTGKEVFSGVFGYWGSPFGVAVYDPELPPDIVPSNCESLQCDHFCVHTPTKGRCVCQEGYQLKKDGITCEAQHAIAGKGIIFTNGTNMCLLDIHAITGSSHTPVCVLSNLNHTRHMQADTNNGIVYFSNSSGQTIKMYNVQTGSISSVAPTGKVSGLFYDWISNDLYWSENDTDTIKVVSTNSDFTKTVYEKIMRVAYLIGNPHNYSLYWLSGEDTYSYSIEGGQMKGDNRHTVVQNKHLKHPVGLYYDEAYNKIYWVDENELKSIKLNDGEMEDYLSVSNANSFLLYKDYVIWTTHEADIRAASIVQTRVETYIDLTEHGAVTGMCIFDPRLQRPERGPCEDMYNNGGCEQICIPTDKGASCQCSFGLQLQKDGKRCHSVHRTTQFALVTDSTHSRIFQIPTKDTVIKASDVIALDIPTISRPHGAVYEPKSQFLYWGEISSQKIRRSRLNGQNENTVYTFDEHIPDRLVFDDSTGNLYFTAIGKSTSSSYYAKYISYVGVLRLADDVENIKHKLLIGGMKDARSLALHPGKGYLFWGEIGSTDTGRYIGRADMDGSNQKQIVADVTSALGLAVDYKANRIYWCDYSEDEIKSSDLDGKGIRLFLTQKGVNIADIALMGQYLYFIGWNSPRITRVNKDTQTVSSWMPDIPELGRLDSIKLYPGDQQIQNDLCKDNNGGCSSFCLPTSIGRKCRCEDRVELRDKQNCQNVCPDVIVNGKIKQGCLIYPGATCDYSCIGHLKKNDEFKHIKCLKNATWNVNERVLCKEVRCDNSLSSVYITGPCDMKIGTRCNYACKNGKQKKYTRTMCSSGGIWIPSTDLCKDAVVSVTKRCTNNIQQGKLDSKCTKAVNTECSYSCDTGYMSAYHQKSVRCLSTQEWNVPLDEICILSVQVADKVSSELQNDVPLISGVLGTFIIIIIIIIVVGVICIVLKSGSSMFTENKSKQIFGMRETGGIPSTDFSSQVKDENSSAFENPLSKQGSAFVVTEGQQ